MNSNVIKVSQASFFISRINPREISYHDGGNHIQLNLEDWGDIIAVPSETQIMYSLESNPSKSLILNLESANSINGNPEFIGS